ncbi:hypothetical protein MMC07_008788 [Pseudocyphellaria aurata]|nr:hypothetical protein [Pseudocyphellaria aurata]
MKPEPFEPSKDIPSLTDKVFLVTGETSGLGREAVLALSRKQPSRIYFTGRNSKAAADIIAQVNSESATSSSSVNITFLEYDFTSLSSVELTIKKFGINQMAHALVVKMVLPTLRSSVQKTGDVRIVFDSSVGFRWTPSEGIRFDELKTTQDYWFAGRWVRYGQSKLANVVYASELARRFPDITTVSDHPGVISTNLWSVNWSLLNRVFVYLATLGQTVPVEEGVRNACWAMTTSKAKLSNGAFYEKVGVVGSPSKSSSSAELGEKLWTWTQNELEKYGN